MFNHVMVGAENLDASKKFYDNVLGALGLPPGQTDSRGRVWYVTPGGTFGITKPIDGRPATFANGGTIGFKAASPKQVEDWHAAGIANGGATCEDPPGLRQPSGLHLAYLRDPAGNKLCAVHRPG